MTVVGPAWSLAGPAGEINNGNIVVPPSNLVSGAIQAVITPPNNANIMLIASVNGGIWRTTNAKAATPLWTPVLDDGIRHLPCGAIAFDLKDTTFNTIVATSAFTSSFLHYGSKRFGVVRSTDGGATWSNVGASATQFALEDLSSVASYNKVIVTGSTKSAGGLFRCADATAATPTFTRISGSGGLPNGPVT